MVKVDLEHLDAEEGGMDVKDDFTREVKRLGGPFNQVQESGVLEVLNLL
jgi:hypothetical protein